MAELNGNKQPFRFGCATDIFPLEEIDTSR